MYTSKEKQYALFNLKTKQIEKETIGNCVLAVSLKAQEHLGLDPNKDLDPKCFKFVEVLNCQSHP